MRWIDVRVNKKPLYDPHPLGVCSCAMCSAGHSPSGRLLVMDTVTGKVLSIVPDKLVKTVNFIMDGYRLVEFTKEANAHRKKLELVNADYSKIEERIMAHYIGEGRELLARTMKPCVDDFTRKHGLPNPAGNRRQRRRDKAKK